MRKDRRKKEVTKYAKLEKKVAALWTRVSTKRQEEENCSLDLQERVCRKYAEDNGIIIKKAFGGTHESAKSEGDKYKQMIAEVARDKEYNIILVYSYDRFSRAGEEALMTKAYLKSKGIYVISATQASDPDTASGTFMENMIFIFNQFENMMRRDKTYGGTLDSLRRGIYCNRTRFGYSRTRKGKELYDYVNEDGKKLRNAWKWKIEGLTDTEITKKLQAMGLRIDYKQLNRIMHDRFYCGYIVHPSLEGGEIEGKHEKMIDEKTFDLANGKTRTGYEQRAVTEMYPLKKYVKCADCGCPFTAYEVKGKGKHYYRCNTRGCSNNQSLEKMHNKYITLLGNFSVKKEYTPLLIKIITNELEVYNDERDRECREIKKHKSEVEAKIKKVISRYGIGEINQETYDVTMECLNGELNECNKSLEKYSEKLSNLEKIARYAVVMSCKLGDLWKNGDYELQQDIQNLIFPEGVLWDKHNDNYLTKKTNCIFDRINYISANYEHH